VHIPDFLACSRTHDDQKTKLGRPNLTEVAQILASHGPNVVGSSTGENIVTKST
jgi:hypothetical protein